MPIEPQFKQPEFDLPPLPKPGEEAEQPLQSQVMQAIAILGAGLGGRPDLAASLQQQLQTQNMAAKEEARARFRDQLMAAQAARAGVVQQAELSFESAEARRAAERAQREAEERAVTEEVFPLRERVGLEKAKQEAELRRLQLEMDATRLAMQVSLRQRDSAINEEQRAQEDQILQLLQVEHKKRADQAEALKAGVVIPQDLAMRAAAGDQAALSQIQAAQAEVAGAAFELDPKEFDRLVRLYQSSAPLLPEQHVRDLVQSAFTLPPDSLEFLNKMPALTASPDFLGFIAGRYSATLQAKGMSEDQADSTAADVLTGELAPADAPWYLRAGGALRRALVPTEAEIVQQKAARRERRRQRRLERERRRHPGEGQR